MRIRGSRSDLRRQMRIVLDIQQHQLPLDSLATSAERHDGGFSKGVFEEIRGDRQWRSRVE